MACRLYDLILTTVTKARCHHHGSSWSEHRGQELQAGYADLSQEILSVPGPPTTGNRFEDKIQSAMPHPHSGRIGWEITEV